MAEFGPAADAGQPQPAVSWTPDGKSLAVVQGGDKLPAIVLVALDTGKVQPVTAPPDSSQGDSTPAVSPTGSSLAFVRNTGTAGNDGGADIWLCDLSGSGLRRLTFDDRGIRGIAWTRDGQDLIYSSNRAGGWHIWRIPAYGGSPKEYTLGGRQAYYPAVGRNRLAFTDSPSVSAIWRVSLSGTPDSDADARPVVRSTAREVSPMYSPDGKKIADVSDQTGNDEVFLCDADGGNRVQVTSLAGPSLGRVRWSPDGKLTDLRGQLRSRAGSLHRGSVCCRQAQACAAECRQTPRFRMTASGSTSSLAARSGKPPRREATRRCWSRKGGPAACGIGGRKVRLLPIAPHFLARPCKWRRRGRGDRSGP